MMISDSSRPGQSLTGITDDDVFEEVGVGHPDDLGQINLPSKFQDLLIFLMSVFLLHNGNNSGQWTYGHLFQFKNDD